jgi:hypothetical protein
MRRAGDMRPLNAASFVQRSSSVFRKVFTTLAVGGAAFLITNTLDEPIIWTVTLSVFIGGVTLVVQFLNDFDNRLQIVELGQARHFATVEELIKNRFSSISEATELFSLVEASAVRADLVKELVRHATRLDGSSHQLIHNFAHAEIERVSEIMKELSGHSDITYDGEDRDWLLALTRNSAATIDAMSFTAVDASGKGFDDGGLWASDLGQRYLEAQQKAMERGVMIRRIFVLDNPEGADDPELLRMCGIHQKLGIQVRILDPLTLPGLYHNWMFDFIVFDSVICYETTPAPWARKGTKPAIVSTRLVLGPQRVAARADGFRDLWSAARDLSSARGELPPGRSGASEHILDAVD